MSESLGMGTRPESQQDIYSKKNKNNDSSIDIIQQTRRIVKGKDQKDRFRIAKQHLQNALEYKTPRLDTCSDNMPLIFQACYNIQTSYLWQTALLILSYIFMYLVIWVHEKPAIQSLLILESVILILMWIDVIMEIYHKSYQVLRLTSRFQLRFYVRITLLMLMLIDQVLVFAVPDLAIRPFLILRSLLPIFYDNNVRKAFEALLSAYKDVFVFLFFYTCVIVGFAVVANQIIQLPQDAGEDPYTSNYRQLDKTIFIMYVMSSYDAYPDNQLVGIRTSLWIYAFFIIFIFLNVFFFVTIPATIVYTSFRETRSKIILIDEIKQQHSLIMSFVSLGEHNLNITQNKLIRFLLYVYKNKVRYVDHITEICLKLDDNNNGIIHVNEYMQLCKVLQADSSMLPPKFHDWDRWLLFRRVINQTFKLKEIILSDKFKVINALLILVTFINCALSIYTGYKVFDVIDDVLIIVYVVEIVVKMVGLGPENFFKDPWNNLDFVIILIGLVLELLPQDVVPHNSDQLFKMARIFRVTILIKLISQKTKLQSEIYIKATRLVSQMAIIIPIVLKFFPLYMISYYVLGVLGMQVFRESAIINHEESPYSNYDQFSNFRTFIGTQLIFVQILVQAGWSMIAYDHAFKFGYFGLTMLFFVLSHSIIVIVLSSLLKGITWQVYYTVHEEFNERTNEMLKIKTNEQNLQKKKEKIKEVEERADQKLVLIPDNLITKELYENKIDLEIFKKLKQEEISLGMGSSDNFSRKQKKRSQFLTSIIKDRKLTIDEIDQHHMISREIVSEDNPNNAGGGRDQNHSIISEHEQLMNQLMQTLNIKDIEDLKQEDIEQEMEKVLSKIILHHKIRYSQTIVYPKIFTDFLEEKLLDLKSIQSKRKLDFNLDEDVIANKDSVDFLTYGLNVLLEIEVSEREQKAMIVQNMVREKIITEEQSRKILTKKLTEKDSSFDSNWIMRKAFLSDTNQQLIKKFEIEYFSSVYGKSFKQINKVTIQPLLRLESRLTYCLRNLLRYPQISQLQFFTILSTIQDTISNKLLKKGSLFKFVYQIKSTSDIWFSIQLRESNELKVHFIKNGIWIYNRSMKPNQVRVAEDIFNWENIDQKKDRTSCEKYIKMLFQSFESLAFCLVNEKNFFQCNPSKHIYDLFTFYKEVKDIKRLSARNLNISKIMLVILSKQDQRTEPLSYDLTDIKIEQEEDNLKKTMFFRFDESQNQTFQKLKRMQLMDYERIVESEGIPFTYIINLMAEIQDIINLYQVNFVYQLQEFLNKKFDEVQLPNQSMSAHH